MEKAGADHTFALPQQCTLDIRVGSTLILHKGSDSLECTSAIDVDQLQALNMLCSYMTNMETLGKFKLKFDLSSFS